MADEAPAEGEAPEVAPSNADESMGNRPYVLKFHMQRKS